MPAPGTRAYDHKLRALEERVVNLKEKIFRTKTRLLLLKERILNDVIAEARLVVNHLDDMGHSDAVVIADAHFPAAAVATRLVNLPGATTPDVLRAIRTVVPLDDSPSLDLMTSADGTVLEVQRELMDAAGTTPETTAFIDRFAYYDVARAAFLVIRTGETRTYGNAVLRKGVVGQPRP
jgi:L-fucose mutarotase